MPAEDKEKIEAAISELEEVKGGDDEEAIDAKFKLVTASQANGNRSATSQAQQAAGAEAGEQPKQEDDVVDAEFEEGKTEKIVLTRTWLNA